MLRRATAPIPSAAPLPQRFGFREWLLAAVLAGSLAAALMAGSVAQDPGYHGFADRRAVFGIPNFGDVVSNLAFLLAGAAGLVWTHRGAAGPMRAAWAVLFLALALVAAGSAYYHWSPDDARLAWDRLPMTLGFMSLVAALVGEHIGVRLGARLLVPLLAAGVASVLYWRVAGDLRPYLWVQGASLLCVPVLMLLYRPMYSHRWLLLAALGWYLLAKAAEVGDHGIYQATQGVLSGHTLKHLLAAAACLSIGWMIRCRRRLRE